MRFDVVTIFPEYLAPLRLSLNWNTTALTGLALGVQYDQM